MGRDYLKSAPTEVRRADRAVDDDAWIRAFLREQPVGVLATVYDGRPYLNSNLFVYDESQNCIYMHTAHVGRTQANVSVSEPVCFTAFSMGRLLPAPVALEFSVEYASVVVFGRATVLAGREEATCGLQLLLDKYAPHLRPGRDYRPVVDEELKRTAVYRIDIDQWSGKRKVVADDFPGAFLYGEQPDKLHGDI